MNLTEASYKLLDDLRCAVDEAVSNGMGKSDILEDLEVMLDEVREDPDIREIDRS